MATLTAVLGNNVHNAYKERGQKKPAPRREQVSLQADYDRLFS